MTFELEALTAGNGDALLLHYGTPTNPRVLVIDGGPKPVYRAVLRPHLLALKGKAAGPLTIRLVVVTHVDDDHIGGIQKMLEELGAQFDARKAMPFQVTEVWHNSFEDTVKPAGLSASWPAEANAIAASIGQGQIVRNVARRMGIQVNAGRALIKVESAASKNRFTMGDGLTLTVLCPREERLGALRERWAEYVREKGPKRAATAVIAAIARPDDAVPNLSSIAVLAECESKTMLLAGDTRADELLAGLKAAGVRKGQNPMNVDVFKLPHHGSRRNCTRELFDAVHARHYVISTNGDDYGHPDTDVLELLLASRPDDKFTIELTYDQQRVAEFLKVHTDGGRAFAVEYPKPGASSITITA